VPTSFEAIAKQLEQYVRDSVRLDTPGPDGKTRRQILQNSLKVTANRLPGLAEKIQNELKTTEIPNGAEHLVITFRDLVAGRSYGFGGPLPLTHQDIKAFTDLYGPLSKWELKLMRRLDNALLDEQARLREGASNARPIEGSS
jgi:hypothetical protein